MLIVVVMFSLRPFLNFKSENRGVVGLTKNMGKSLAPQLCRFVLDITRKSSGELKLFWVFNVNFVSSSDRELLKFSR